MIRSMIFAIGALTALCIPIAFAPFALAEDEKPAVPGDAKLGKERADRLFAGLRSTIRFKKANGSISWQSAEAFGAEGLVLKKIMIKGERAPLSIEEIRISKLDWKSLESPAYADIEIIGVASPNFRNSPFIATFIETNGIVKVTFDLKVAYVYRPKVQVLDIRRLEMRTTGLGTLSIALRLHAFDVAVLASLRKKRKIDLNEAMPILALMQVGHLRIRFKGAGAIDNIATMQAKVNGGDKDKFIDDMIREIESTKAKQTSAVSRESAEAILQFLRNRSALTIQLSPTNPVAILPLALKFQSAISEDSEKLAKELGFKLTAE